MIMTDYIYNALFILRYIIMLISNIPFKYPQKHHILKRMGAGSPSSLQPTGNYLFMIGYIRKFVWFVFYTNCSSSIRARKKVV
ncbi:hypothetical protein BD408DRAFT_423101 [Parasitella parasitica]|nr:hypothetical protein BD408DRAFT_423101 [Parasitella parasitica]